MLKSGSAILVSCGCASAGLQRPEIRPTEDRPACVMARGIEGKFPFFNRDFAGQKAAFRLARRAGVGHDPPARPPGDRSTIPPSPPDHRFWRRMHVPLPSPRRSPGANGASPAVSRDQRPRRIAFAERATPRLTGTDIILLAPSIPVFRCLPPDDA